MLASRRWNFAVFAPDATEVKLCLFLPDTEELLAELSFLARTGENLALRSGGYSSWYFIWLESGWAITASARVNF